MHNISICIHQKIDCSSFHKCIQQYHPISYVMHDHLGVEKMSNYHMLNVVLDLLVEHLDHHLLLQHLLNFLNLYIFMIAIQTQRQQFSQHCIVYGLNLPSLLKIVLKTSTNPFALFTFRSFSIETPFYPHVASTCTCIPYIMGTCNTSLNDIFLLSNTLTHNLKR